MATVHTMPSMRCGMGACAKRKNSAYRTVWGIAIALVRPSQQHLIQLTSPGCREW